MTRNVFVLGCDELGQLLLPRLNHAEGYAFHDLLSLEQAVHAEDYAISSLMDEAISELDAFPGAVDAIVTYWDFPTSALSPLLREKYGLPGSSLEAVLKCEHKYWSRIEQGRWIPDSVPPFQAVDPFGADPLGQIELPYPFWIKPVKAHSSQLGFRIDNAEMLRAVLPTIRNGIGRFARPFAEILAYADVPPDIAAVTGYHCVAESIISSGFQCTLEGYVQKGRARVYGVVDTARDPAHPSVLVRYTYPSRLPEPVQKRMIERAERFMEGIGYEDAAFNIEFYYDPSSERIWLLEVNSRLSRSHAALFWLVDGAPHFQVMVDVGLGVPPAMPRNAGPYAVAAKHMLRVYRDGIVRRVPTETEVRQVEKRFPGTIVELNVREGMHLSHLLHQDPFSYEVGVLFVGADDADSLDDRIRECEALLRFDFEPTGRSP